MQPAVGADLARTWAIVPIRGLETAKTRLGGDLDAEERRDLVVDMLRRTLVATRDARLVAGTVVVTMDPTAAGIARDHRAVGLVERVPGLNGAISAARSVAIARAATAVLVLPADLPAINAAAVDALIEAASAATTTTKAAAAASAAAASAAAASAAAASAAAASAAASSAASESITAGLVALVTDQHGSGTNALLISPPALIDPLFGTASRDLHRAAAAAAGATYLEFGGPLALDVDTSDDLIVAEAALGAIRG